MLPEKVFLFGPNATQMLAPELYLSLVVTVLLIFGVVYNSAKSYNYPILCNSTAWSLIHAFFYVILLCLSVGFVCPTSVSGQTLAAPADMASTIEQFLRVDSYTTLIKLIVIFSAIAVVLASLAYIKVEKINHFEYIVLIGLSCLSLLLLVSSYDLISMYLAIELQGLAFYILATFKRNSEFSTEAGLKYFVLGAFASGILLFGCSLLYGFTGSTGFEDLSKIFAALAFTDPSIDRTDPAYGITLAVVFITVALLFKVTAAPFHMWVPDVYEGAPTSVVVFFATAPKVAVFAFFLRLYYDVFYSFSSVWNPIIIICSLVSMLLASFAAVYQKKLKRFLAYSAIAHIGYLLIGFSTLSNEGLGGLSALLIPVFYFIVYIVTVLNFFVFLLSAKKRNFGAHGYALWEANQVGHSKQVAPKFALRTNWTEDSRVSSRETRIIHLTDLSSFATQGASSHTLIAVALAISLFSFAGIPPLAGFYAKFVIFFSAISSNSVFLSFLAIIGILTSVLSSFYYIRLVKLMFFVPQTGSLGYRLQTQMWSSWPKENALLFGITFFFILGFFIYPAPLFLLLAQ